MSEHLTIVKGLHKNLPNTKIPGRILITTDTCNMFVDIDEDTRIQINAKEASKLLTSRNINGISFDGTSDITITADPISHQLTSENLNTIKNPGLYYARENNTCANKPDSVDTFGLVVYKTADGYIQQELTSGNTSTTKSKKFFRQFNNSTWSTWSYYYSNLYPQTTITGNAGSATKLKTSRNINGISFDGTSSITNFCICDTAANVNPKIINFEEFSPIIGGQLTILFKNGNTAAPSPLQIRVNNDIVATLDMYRDNYPYIWNSNTLISFIVTNIKVTTDTTTNITTKYITLRILAISQCGSPSLPTGDYYIPLIRKGVWTPDEAFNGISLENASGNYVKISSLIICKFKFTIPESSVADSSRIIYFTGLPYSNGLSLSNESKFSGFCNIKFIYEEATTEISDIKLVNYNSSQGFSISAIENPSSFISGPPTNIYNPAIEVEGEFSYLTDEIS